MESLYLELCLHLADLDFNRKSYFYPGETKSFRYHYYDAHQFDLLTLKQQVSSLPSVCINFTAELIILNFNDEIKVG